MAATHYGVHAVSGAELLTAIDTANTAGVSGQYLHLVPVGNGLRIAVIGDDWV